MRQLRRSAPALTALVILAGCSGSAGNADTTTPESSSVASEVVPTSAAVPNTSTTTTTLADTTTTTTTSAPTSTTTTASPATDPEESSHEEIIAEAAVAASDAYTYAVYNIGDPGALDRLRSTHTPNGPALNLGLQNYEEFIENGQLVRANPDVPDTTVVESVTIVEDSVAEVVTCTIDAGVVFEPGAAEDGSDLIVDDSITAYRDRSTMFFVDGAWLRDSGSEIQAWPGETACPAA